MNIRALSLVIICTAFHLGSGTAIADTLEERVHKIIIPRIEFRNANPADVFAFIRDAVSATPPEAHHSIGLSHVYTNRPQQRIRHIYGTEDGTPIHIPMDITLNMRRVTLYDAIKYITETMGIAFRIADDELHLYTQDGQRIILLETIIEDIPEIADEEKGSWETDPWTTDIKAKPDSREERKNVEPETGAYP